MDTQCAQLIKKNRYDLLYKSGHFFGQMGLWQECVDSPQPNSYFMANFINSRTHANASLFLGMCLPAVCRKEFVMELMNYQLSNVTVQQQITKLIGAPLEVGSMDVNPQDYTFQTLPWFYFTVTFLAILLFLSVFSVFWTYHRKKEKYTAADKIIQAFNLTESLKIFVYKSNYLNIFNGIKTICMLWVIFGHQFSVRLKYDVNISGIPGQVEKFFYLFVTGAFLAVDVFFFIGGFLVAYSFMREKSKSILKYPLAVLHRVLRFWPSYAIVILIYYSVYIHSDSGPLWKENMTLGQVPYCSGAWKTLLFVDNLVDNGEKMCMGWGWYLQNDMQIFVFSLFFIYAYTRNRKLGYGLLAAMVALGLSLNFYGVYDRSILQVTHLKDFIKWNEYFVNIYIKPWVRCPPYIFGLICGLLHMEYLQAKKKGKEDPNNPIFTNNIFVKLRQLMLKKRFYCWISQFLGVLLMIGTIILPHDLQVGHTWPQWGHAMYLSIQKLTFTLGVYFLILPTMLEVPNISFFLLDTKFFNAISKISFWTYLFHFMVVQLVSYGEKVDFYYTPETVIPLYLAIATISMFFAFLGTILIEVPFSKLQKMLFSVLMKKKDRKLVENSQTVLANGKESLVLSDKESIVLSDKSSLLSSVGGQLKQQLLQPGINRSVNQ